jgi:hypothetical protein
VAVLAVRERFHDLIAFTGRTQLDPRQLTLLCSDIARQMFAFGYEPSGLR